MSHMPKTDAMEYLRTVAISRIVLDNVPNLQSSWVTMGMKVGQMALRFGCNDFGSLMIEENVVSAANTTHRTTTDEIEHLIRDAGFTPRRRRQDYSILPADAPPAVAPWLPDAWRAHRSPACASASATTRTGSRRAAPCAWAASMSRRPCTAPGTVTATRSATPSPTRCSAPPRSATSARCSPTPTRRTRGRTPSRCSPRPCARVHAAGWRVGNVDVTVVAERPKIGPHREAMRARLAEALGVPVADVFVKGKTNERHGVDRARRGTRPCHRASATPSRAGAPDAERCSTGSARSLRRSCTSCIAVAAFAENVFPPLPADTAIALGAFRGRARRRAPRSARGRPRWSATSVARSLMFVLGRRLGARVARASARRCSAATAAGASSASRRCTRVTACWRSA